MAMGSTSNGGTHGFEIDDRFVYTCATTPLSKPGSTHEVVILDYSDPRNPTLAGALHIQGQHIGEEYAPQDQLNCKAREPRRRRGPR